MSSVGFREAIKNLPFWLSDDPKYELVRKREVLALFDKHEKDQQAKIMGILDSELKRLEPLTPDHFTIQELYYLKKLFVELNK